MRFRGFKRIGMVVVLLAGTAWAKDKPNPPSKESAPASKVRRDPKGLTGVSPYVEAIGKGSSLYLVGDYPGAAAAFQEASKLEPNLPTAHFFLGLSHRGNKALDKAEESWQAATKHSNADPTTGARVLFAQADALERAGKWEEAKAAWEKYGKFVSENPKAQGMVNTARERQSAIARRAELAESYAKVRERIEARLKQVAK